MPNHSLLADEHIPRTVVQRLDSYGIEVLHVEDIGMKGASDPELINYALENNYSILTRDDDFRKLGEENQVGVILQTKRQSKKQTASDVIKLLNSVSVEELESEVFYIPWS